MSNSAENPSVMDVDRKSQDDVTIEKRVNQVERILICSAGDWCGILDVEQNCTALKARKAALNILFLIKDRFENDPEDMKPKANKATQLVVEAAENLKAGESYVEVDKDGQKANPPPESQPFSPISAVKEIYKQATDSVLVLFSGADDTARAELEIHLYNENIRDIVQKDNEEATILEQISGLIDLKTIISYVSLRKEHEALQDRDITTLSRSERAKVAQSTKFLGQMGPIIDEFNTRKEYPSTWNWDRESNPKLWVAKPSDTTDRKMDYPPGQTKDGANILGYIPTYETSRQGEKLLKGCKFAIEVDGDENLGCMKIATWMEVGREAGQAYVDQPSEEKCYIPWSHARYSPQSGKREEFSTLLGFWADYSISQTRWGRAYCWIELQDGIQDVVSKGCFERIVGNKDTAIAQIYDLFDNDESKFPWRTPPTGLGSKYIREGPYGPVAIQTRKMIDNGPQLNQQITTEKVDLAAILARLQADSEANKAQMELQKADMDRMFSLLSERLESVRV